MRNESKYCQFGRILIHRLSECLFHKNIFGRITLNKFINLYIETIKSRTKYIREIINTEPHRYI